MAQKQKKNQKFGRNSRCVSSKNYTIVHRWKINGYKRKEKQALFRLKKSLRKIKVPRGTARALRRKKEFGRNSNLMQFSS